MCTERYGLSISVIKVNLRLERINSVGLRVIF